MSLSVTERRLRICKLVCLAQAAVAFAAVLLVQHSGVDLVRAVAVDAIAYRDEIIGGAPARLHSKLYALLGTTGHLAWSVIALNFTALVVVFLGNGDPRRGPLVRALVPVVLLSLLFHNLLPLKDSLFLCVYLFFINALRGDMTRPWQGAGLAVVFFALARLRPEMGFLLYSFLLLFAVSLAAQRRLQPRRWLAVAACLLLVSATVTELQPECQRVAQQTHQLSNLSSRMLWLRRKFSERYPSAGSNLSKHSITAASGLVRRMPQALLTGALAPLPLRQDLCRFPGCGAVLALEMIGLYLLWALFLRSLRRGALLVTLYMALGLTSLGLVVVNMGALYRLRYPYVVLLLLLCLKGVRRPRAPCYSRRRCSDGSPSNARNPR